MRRILTLASNQLDGVCASAIIARLAYLKKMPIRQELFLYAKPEKLKQTLLEAKEYSIFVLDIPADNIPELHRTLRKCKQTNMLAYWNCHIPQAKDAKELIIKNFRLHDIIGEHEKKCSAELVQQRFLMHDSIAKKLADLAHDQEFWERKEELSTKLADIIISRQGKNLISSLAKGVYWTASMENIWQKYIDRKNKELQYIIKRASNKRFMQYVFAFSFAYPLVSSAEAGQSILDSGDIDVSCTIFTDGRIFFRKKEGVEIDLRRLAERFFGGGHHYAAGGVLQLGTGMAKNITNETWKDIRFQVEQKIHQFFESDY